MRIPRFAVMFFLASARLLSAQQASAPEGSTEPQPAPPVATSDSGRMALFTGRLTGHVFCGDTHRPARGAVVSVVRVSGEAGEGGVLDLVTRVNSDGTFAAEHLPPGKYTAFAALPGYLTDFDDVLKVDPHMGTSEKMQAYLEQRGTVAVQNGANSTYDLTLARGAAISGKVQYEDGAPAVNVDLLVENIKDKAATGKDEVEHELEMAFQNRIIHHENYTTDDQGRFRIAGLRPGSFRIAVTLPAKVADAASVDMTQIGLSMFQVADPRAPRFYAGDTVFRSKAKVFRVQGGDEISGTDITIPLDGFHRVAGQASTADGRAVNIGDVTLRSDDADHLTYLGGLSRDGSFHLEGVPPGTYSLSVTGAHIGVASRNGESGMNGFVRLTPGEAMADTEVTLVLKDGDADDVRVTMQSAGQPQLPPNAGGGASQ